jgi:hypothetical protein
MGLLTVETKRVVAEQRPGFVATDATRLIPGGKGELLAARASA